MFQATGHNVRAFSRWRKHLKDNSETRFWNQKIFLAPASSNQKTSPKKKSKILLSKGKSFLVQEPRFGAGQVAQKSSFSMGFRSYVRDFFAAFFAPSPSFTAMVFPCPEAVVLRGLSSPKNRVLERDK